MAFANGEVVMQRMEKFIRDLFSRLEALGLEVPKTPFVRMTYDHAMTRYGVDKPDVRINALVRHSDLEKNYY